MERLSERTPEVMDHVEVADLWEKASHRFAVVLAESDGSGPADENNFSHKASPRPT